MYQTKIGFVFVLLTILTSTQITRLNFQPIRKVTIPTIPLYQYKGQAQVSITEGETQKLQFYVDIFEDSANCTHTKCFYGYVKNYITYENDEPQNFPGYFDDELKVKPVFKFSTNGIDDFVITHSKQLDYAFKEIIQIFCQEINPILTKKPKIQLATSVLRTSNIRTPTKTRTLQERDQEEQEQQKPRFTFLNQEVNDEALRENQQLKYGDRLATVTQQIALKDLDTKKSELTENIRLNSQNLVGLHSQKYDFSLQTDEGDQGDIQLQNLEGFVEIKVTLEEKSTFPKAAAQVIIALITKIEGQNDTQLSFAVLNFNRVSGANVVILRDEPVFDRPPKFDDLKFDIGSILASLPQPGSADSVKFGNQQYTGVNVVQRLKGLSPTTTVNSFKGSKRLLQVTQKFPIVDYRRTLFHKTILSKTFKVQFHTKCELWILPFDHQVYCVGNIYYTIFGSTKSFKVYEFSKSVAFTWNWAKTYTGGWAFKIWIGLPKPVNFIGFNFYINVGYKISLSLSAQNTAVNPYTMQVKAVADATVDTDSSAGLRLVVVEGGVFIKGRLVHVTTDPTATASYYFLQKKLELKIKWYAELKAFEANWGFYWRRWRLFKGWTGKMIIKQWKLKSVYKKWKIWEQTITKFL